MIYTVTFNPSLDYIVTVNDFMTGIVNRTSKEIIFPGGKGINVSMVLKNLGCENTALGFMAGFTGREIIRLLEEKGISTDFIHVAEGTSRINVKLRAQKETEINGQGPAIASADIKKLYEKLDSLQDGDILVHGHTHLLKAEKVETECGTITVLNPGSVSIPKGGNPNTYAILENGVFTIYSLDGEVVKELKL